jgi:hypothetical protein
VTTETNAAAPQVQPATQKGLALANVSLLDHVAAAQRIRGSVHMNTHQLRNQPDSMRSADLTIYPGTIMHAVTLIG